MMRFFLGILFLPFFAIAQPFTERDIAFLGDRNKTDWELRVLANGGAQPSANTVAAMERFRLKQIERGITNKLWNVCVHVPDSVIAAFTPIFLHKGWGYWTNTFVSGDLTVNGIKGDGSTKMADTGVTAVSGQALTAAGDGGMSVLITEVPRGSVWTSTGRNQTLLGRADVDDDPRYQLGVTVNGVSFWIPGDVAGAHYVTPVDWLRVGWLSGNQDGTVGDDIFLYGAAPPLETFRTIASDLSVVPVLTSLANTITEFCIRRGATNQADSFSSNRISFAAIHDYLTATESSNLWWDAKTLREELGGGTGDPVHDWNVYNVAQGGSEISTTTSNAARAYLGRMNDAGIALKMFAANPLTPDNLVAASIPLIWRAGHPRWQNTAFGTTNLSVHGIDCIGAAKYFRTGISNTTIINTVNATTGLGYTVMATNIGAQHGGTTGSGSTWFGLAPESSGPSAGNNGLAIYYGGTFNANQELTATNFHGGFTNGMFTSGNSLNSTEFYIYVAAQTVPHYAVTNDAGIVSVLGANHEVIACGAMSDNSPLTIAGAGSGAISYVAAHNGLTQTESSNHYVAVYEFRLAVGGGNR